MVHASEIEQNGGGDSDDKESLACYCRRPEHEYWLAEILKKNYDEILGTLAIKRYSDLGYLPSEVLVTLVRRGYGGSARVKNALALSLNERLVIELKRYLKRNMQWYSVIQRSSEAEIEAVAYVRERIFWSTVDVSFAEVSFGQFVATRLLDWFRAEVRLKNQAMSVDALKRMTDDEHEVSVIDQVVDDVGLTPHEALELKQLIEGCRGAVQVLPEKLRVAVTLCGLQEMTHKEAAKVMGLSESAVQKYVKAAHAALRKECTNE